jgi:hypothetical protein
MCDLNILGARMEASIHLFRNQGITIIIIIIIIGQIFLKKYFSILLPKIDNFSKVSPYMIHNWTHLP